MAQLFDKRLLVEMPRCGPRDTPWLFCLHCRSSAERTALRVHLATNGVETRNFFFPLHLEPMFDGAYVDFDMPTAQLLGSVGFSLPTHPGLDINQIDQIAIEVCNFFNETSNHDDDQRITLKRQKDDGVVGPTVQSRITELC
uniref:DegT/DnrJ/EryC1/StrS aminotransferase family protein n=1 Tax=Globodera pallida TaxID=36090 RepID=A0A183C9L8_GLOPA